MAGLTMPSNLLIPGRLHHEEMHQVQGRLFVLIPELALDPLRFQLMRANGREDSAMLGECVSALCDCLADRRILLDRLALWAHPHALEDLGPCSDLAVFARD